MRIGVSEAGELIGKTLVKAAHNGILNGSKSGRHYPGMSNQSSAPGEYSANQSGDLLNSINYRAHAAYVSFYATSGHAGYQEYGTSKMGARPNLEMAIEEQEGVIEQIIEQIVWRAIGGG